VRAQASNVVVTAVDAAGITADGATWTAAETVKVNLRGRATLADVLVGMRVHLRGWSSAGALTVEHVVVPNTPENRALQGLVTGGSGKGGVKKAEQAARTQKAEKAARPHNGADAPAADAPAGKGAGTGSRGGKK